MLIDDNTYNALQWENVEAKKLDEIVPGFSLTGAEPIDYPITDGVILYGKDVTGNIIALDIGTDPLSISDDTNPFYIKLGRI